MSTSGSDLATLRRTLDSISDPGPWYRQEGYDALSRVEAELSRLREQVKLCPYCAGAFVPETDGYEGACPGCKRAEAAEARCARLQQALAEAEASAVKAAQLLPMTLSTSVEADHRNDHASRAGWLLRHKVLPVAREALAGPDTPADSQEDKT